MEVKVGGDMARVEETVAVDRAVVAWVGGALVVAETGAETTVAAETEAVATVEAATVAAALAVVALATDEMAVVAQVVAEMGVVKMEVAAVAVAAEAAARTAVSRLQTASCARCKACCQRMTPRRLRRSRHHRSRRRTVFRCLPARL